MMSRLRSMAVPAYLAAALLLGGSAQGVWGNLILQLAGLGLIGWSLLLPTQRADETRVPAGLLVATLLLVGVQLLPLPPELWTMFPGRETVREGYRLLDEPLPWLPISLDPYASIATASMMIPAVAAFLAMTRLGAFDIRWLAVTIVTGATAQVLLGLLQVTDGDGWYFYEITNYGAATGFFANSNHLATLLVMSLPFLVAATATENAAGSPPGRRREVFAVAGGLGLLLLLGIVLTRSTAGALLAAAVLAASVVLVPWSFSGKRVFFGAAAAAGLCAAIALPSFSANDGAGMIARAKIWTGTIETSAKFAPWGSGLGTFETVYRAGENPSSVDRVYVNRAHNDYLQIALETGLPGSLILAVFLGWWIHRTLQVWRLGSGTIYVRASTIASGALILHSLVDYPIRTGAVSTVFAACVALMAGARSWRALESARPARPPRHLVLE